MTVAAQFANAGAAAPPTVYRALDFLLANGFILTALLLETRGLGGADVRADGDVHADEAGRGREHRSDEEADRRSPAELVVEAEQKERHDRDEGDRLVLPPEVRRGALLNGARDLAHFLVPGRLLEQPLQFFVLRFVDRPLQLSTARELSCVVVGAATLDAR